ncbi:LamG-like jellyroll fold domain-containing protein [Gillisia sp. CAL575]|uniref:LamG-like jellyroll fold domain-containing protein n=1 Tax=Gillisia sp. CAL575 TaxID=985255 RepID=UPI00039D7D04|nr:LamG-like jellyroll fold domain-containing protein [Gillisia sp. CAL575]
MTTTTTATNSTGITYSLDAASLTGGNTIVAATGAVTYAAGWSGTTTITASAAGCNGPATTTHVVTVTPSVTINAFSPATSTRCQGAGSVTTTTTATNSTGITYSLDAASVTGGNTIVAATGAVTYAAGWNGTTTITASAAGCNGPATTTHVVTVTPTVTISAFSPATSARCQGAGSVTTTTTATNSTGITYSLDAASVTGGNTIVAATGAVTYVAGWSGTTTITASAAGCNGPVTTTHVVTVTPTITINAFSPTTSTRCQGAGTVTTTTTANNSTGITYSLDATTAAFSGNSINSSTGAVTYAAGWGGTTTITASAAGCNGPATTTHVVTVRPSVSINAFSPATSTRCQGAGSVTTTTTATNSTGITYSLDAASLTGGNTIVAATGVVTYAAGWSGTTTITASAAGCNGPKTTTHVVTVTPTVTINAFSPATSTRCQGAGSVTTATTATNSTGITYSLDAASLTGGNTIVAATGAVTYSAGWSGTTTITASAAGCNGPKTTTHVVTVTPTVTISAFSPTTSTRCQGAGSVTTTTTATNSTGITYSLDAASLAGGNTIVAATGAVTYAAGWSGTTIITASAAGCNGPKTTAHVVTVDPVPVGGKLLFSKNNERIYLSCVSPASSNSLSAISLSGVTAGTVVAWKYRKASNPDFTTIQTSGTSLSAAQIYALGVTESIVFQVEIASGSCIPNALSQTAILSVIPANIKPAPVKVDPAVVCKGEEVTLSSSTGYGEDFGKFEGGAFDNSSITNKGWRITDKNGNSDYNFESSADNRRPDKWLRTNPHDFATANITTNAITDQRWDTKLGNSGNKGFAIVSGNNPSTFETPVFALSGLDEAILTFDQAFNLTSGATIKIEISTNGGASYTSEPILYTKTGPLSSGNYDRFGEGTPGVNQMSIDLGNYLGRGNLRIRFKYEGKRDGDIWALDNIKVPEGPQDIILEWRDYSDPSKPEGVFIGNNSSEQWEPKLIGWNVFEVKTQLNLDSSGNNCSSLESSKTIRVFVYDRYTTTISAVAGTCGNYTVNLTANASGAFGGNVLTYPTKDFYIGEWVITKSGVVADPTTYTLVNSDSNSILIPKNNPNAQFEANNSGEFTFTWKLTSTAVYPVDYFDVTQRGKVVQNNGCPPVLTPTPVQFQDCTTLDFDGIDDYVDLGNTYGGSLNSKSIEAWIRPKSSMGTIISGAGFEIKMQDLPTTIIPNTRWYHLAVTNGKLYIDGIQVGNAGTGIGGNKTLIGARWNNTTKKAENYFSGWIEEVRIWKKSLTVEQIHFMMNQHLQNATNMGKEIPMPVPGALLYSDLEGYYPLISKIPDPLNLETFDGSLMPLNGFTPDISLSIITPGRLYNMTTHQENTAPLPYISANPGEWKTLTTWLRPTVWDFPNSSGIAKDVMDTDPSHTETYKTPIDWNIVRTNHNIQSGDRDITVLGLKSETLDKRIEIAGPGTKNENNPGQMLRVTNYLLLDGNIDLVGESQLLQDQGSILAETSKGWLKRDQQGKVMSFNYNYWSSPVSAQLSPNNSPYLPGEVMNYGWDNAVTGTVKPLVFTADSNPYGADNTTMNTCPYWLWRFHGPADDYDSWIFIGKTGSLNTGEGHTMKGTIFTGTTDYSHSQNYGFKGKPHNGDITLTSIPDQNYLVGNPYPSAVDSEEFILDNLDKNTVNGATNTKNLFNGVIYFWDHFSGATHILREYIGGYATLNLIGGLQAISSDERINANENEGSKTPTQFIPVGQGFFVNSGTDEQFTGGKPFTISPGNLIFKNSQRVFARETSGNSIFLKPEIVVKSGKEEAKSTTSKIRISFKSPKGYVRQLLVGANPNTTNGFDLGYDAPMIEYNLEDMYWVQEGNFLVIQGVPDFGKDQILPIGVRIEKEGEFKIKIDTLENMNADHTIYLKDIVLDTIHDLRSGPYTSTSKPGEITDRFQLIFYKELSTPDPDPIVVEEPVIDDFSEISLLHSYSANEMMVLNPKELNISVIHLFDLNGKLLEVFDEVPSEAEIRLKVSNYSEGIYILKMHTDTEVITRKIIIKK